MPAILTHYTFSSKHMRDEVRPYFNVVNVGSQGPDPLFFNGYRLRTRISRPNKKEIQEWGHTIHHSDISEIYPLFFEYANKSEHKELLYAYIEGLLIHYIVDRNCHGFVFSRCGDNIGDPNETINWAGRHCNYEGMIDFLMGKKAGTYTRKTWRLLRIKNAELKEISKMWKYVNDNTAKTPGFSALTFYHTIKDYRFVMKVINGLGNLSGNFVKMLAGNMSTPYGLHMQKKCPKAFKDYDFLNLKHEDWLDPYTGEVRNEDFITLMHKSFPDYEVVQSIIEKARSNNDIKEDFKAFVNNLDHESSINGLPRRYRSPIWNDLK